MLFNSVYVVFQSLVFSRNNLDTLFTSVGFLYMFHLTFRRITYKYEITNIKKLFDSNFNISVNTWALWKMSFMHKYNRIMPKIIL